MNLLSDILQSFIPITLAEMDGVKLMNRTDRKFCFHISKLPAILSQIHPYYKILEVEQNKISRYKTLYYDTANFNLYKMHLYGKLNRYKVRHRTYLESNLGFFEVKFKNNKGRTIKSRVHRKEVPNGFDETIHTFIQSKSTLNSQSLIPAIWVKYNRITLVSRESAERLTIDLNLEFTRNDTNLCFEKLVIAEVKQDKKQSSVFLNVMKENNIREGSISKYAMGIAMTCDVRQNNFKEKLKTISNITNDSHHTFTSH